MGSEVEAEDKMVNPGGGNICEQKRKKPIPSCYGKGTGIRGLVCLLGTNYITLTCAKSVHVQLWMCQKVELHT